MHPITPNFHFPRNQNIKQQPHQTTNNQNPQYFSADPNNTYIGELGTNNLPDGKGLLINRQASFSIQKSGIFSNGVLKNGIEETRLSNQTLISKYNGQFINNIRHGTGELIVYTAGSVIKTRYVGYFVDGKIKHGIRCQYKDGHIISHYEGYFLNDEPHDDNGQSRTYKQDKLQYSCYGNFKNGVFVYGNMRSPTVTYTGEAFCDRANGRGRLIVYEQDSNIIKRMADGIFKDGILLQGECIKVKGSLVSQYKGNFLDSSIIRGECIKVKGSIISQYEGNFLDGSIMLSDFIEVQGAIISQYKGNFFNGKPHDKNGQLEVFEGRTLLYKICGSFDAGACIFGTFSKTGILYTGQFANDQADGYGKLTISEDDSIVSKKIDEGIFKDGVLAHGTRTLLNNGVVTSEYKGYFLNNEPHGENGQARVYENNILIREFYGDFENGRFVNGTVKQYSKSVYRAVFQ